MQRTITSVLYYIRKNKKARLIILDYLFITTRTLDTKKWISNSGNNYRFVIFYSKQISLSSKLHTTGSWAHYLH